MGIVIDIATGQRLTASKKAAVKNTGRVDNYAAFYGLLNRMNDPDSDGLKKSIVKEYTRSRTDSLREMSAREYALAVKGMERIAPGISVSGEALRRKRSAALRQIQMYGVDTSDWSRVNAFCEDKRIAGKEFRKLGLDELDALTVKVRAICRKVKS